MYTLENIFDIKNKTVLITGGYGYLGSGISKALIDLDALVIVLGRDEEKGHKLSNEVSYKENIFFYKCDVSDYNNIKSVFEKIKKEQDTIDILINNASYGSSKKFEEFEEEEWKNGIDGTINNYFRVTKSFLPLLKKPGAKIINIASMYGMVSPDPKIYGNSGFDNPANYGAGKAAIIQFTKYLAVHLAKDGINVNCISPGPFPSKKVQENKKFIEQLNSKVPLNRIGQPNELIGAVLLLASDASSYINGHNLVVDGGWTIW
jgi:gluconate 5-dehydrogenase